MRPALALPVLVLLGLAGAARAAGGADAACGMMPAGEPTTLTATDKGLAMADGTGIVLAGIAFPAADPAGVPALPGGLDGRAVHVAAAGPADRYGRIPTLVTTPDGGLIQADLVRAGLAFVRPDAIDDGCAKALLAEEDTARRSSSGLWADSKFVTKATDETSLLDRNGLYGLVQGRVVSLGYGSRMVFIDFGRNFRTDFTVMVPESLHSRLREAGIALDSLEGRAVRVRGVIEESGGPAIRLAHPLALELLDRTE